MTATLDAKIDTRTQDFDVEDIEYLRHGDKPLLARVFKPRGEGPFPALVECHGGAWCLQDRFTEKLRHQAMAQAGFVSISLDFRSGNEAPYPASVQDINYAVRWAKLNARMLSGETNRGHRGLDQGPRHGGITAHRLLAGVGDNACWRWPTKVRTASA